MSRTSPPALHEVLVSHLVGGAAVVAIRLAAAAPGRGLHARAWVPGTGPATEALDRERIEWRRYDLEAMRGTGRARHLAACAKMLPGLWQASRPLVHVHNPTVYGLLRPALTAARARTVAHFHIEPTSDEIAWALGSPPSHVIACARYISASIEAFLRARSMTVPVTTVPNAIDLDRFVPGDRDAARARLGLTSDCFVVLMLANLAPHKGQTTLVRAIDVLVRRGVPVEGWLVGEDRSHDRQYEKDLRALVTELGLTNAIRFLGFRKDAPDLLQASDAFVLPSTHEGLPLSVLEAQATRVPVIGSTIPGIKEVVEDGQTGFTVPADAANGYADRLQTLFSNQSLREKITAAAATRVSQEHAWTTMEERVFGIYRSLMGSPAGA